MGIVWKVYHKGVPLLGVPGITLDQWLGSWVISPTYTWGTPWGCNPLSLTFDPNFLEHPGRVFWLNKNDDLWKGGEIFPCKELTRRFFAVQPLVVEVCVVTMMPCIPFFYLFLILKDTAKDQDKFEDAAEQGRKQTLASSI